MMIHFYYRLFSSKMYGLSEPVQLEPSSFHHVMLEMCLMVNKILFSCAISWSFIQWIFCIRIVAIPYYVMVCILKCNEVSHNIIRAFRPLAAHNFGTPATIVNPHSSQLKICHSRNLFHSRLIHEKNFLFPAEIF